ncbi:hypothetical protein ACQJBY_009075 [Aegilops geniculata]
MSVWASSWADPSTRVTTNPAGRRSFLTRQTTNKSKSGGAIKGGAEAPISPDSMSRSGGGGRGRQQPEAESAAVPVPGPCASAHRALAECHRRAARGPLQPEVLCRHLNRALAECVVSMCCPGETDAVRTLCGSSGTALKRSQCERARIDLSLCLEAHT